MDAREAAEAIAEGTKLMLELLRESRDTLEEYVKTIEGTTSGKMYYGRSLVKRIDLVLGLADKAEIAKEK